MSATTEKWTIFGERLKTELERQGMSLRQFADKTGITLTTACRYAHSQRTPRATEILKAAKALGVTCDYMLGLSDDPHKTRDGWTLPTQEERSNTLDKEKKSDETLLKTDRNTVSNGDFISRQAAIDGFYEIASDIDYLCSVGDFAKYLENMPSARPEIVRCKDCKYYSHPWYCEAWNNSQGFPAVSDEMFCSMAERRTDEND